jgi:hypothetical protein
LGIKQKKMAEPLPSAATDADTEQRLPANAEDRKAAAALSALNANEISQSGDGDDAKIPSAAAQEALGKAMSRLEIAAGGPGAANKAGGAGALGAGKVEGEKKDEGVKKKAVKVAAEDVTLLV